MTTAEKYQIILAMYRDGLGFSRISKQTGFSKSTIVRCLRTHEPNREALRSTNIEAQRQRYAKAAQARQEAKALTAQRRALVRLMAKRASEAASQTPEAIEARKQAAREKYQRNRERALASQRRYYEANRERIGTYWKTLSADMKERRREAVRRWRRMNPEKAQESRDRFLKDNPLWHVAYRQTPQARHYRAAYKRLPHVRMANSVRKRIKDALRGRRAAANVFGCSLSFLRAYIEARFRDGMTWENYGRVWHVDHVRPVASFDLTKKQDRQRVNHYTNLQPLFAVENIAKGAQIEQQALLPIGGDQESP